MNRACLMAVLLLIFIPISAAGSNDHDEYQNSRNYINGIYSFTMTQKCEVNIESAIENIHLLGEPVLLIEWTIDGIARLRKDGTGESTFRALRFISGRQTTENILSGRSEGTCNLTYEIQQDRRFSGDISCDGINSTGKSFTTSSFLVTGNISRDKQTIILSDTDDVEETIEVDNFGLLTGVCGRSGTAVKIHKSTARK